MPMIHRPRDAQDHPIHVTPGTSKVLTTHVAQVSLEVFGCAIGFSG